VKHATSGAFTLTLTDKGTFSGRMRLDGGTHPFRGKFDLTGVTEVVVNRPRKTPITAVFEIDLLEGADQVNGTVLSSDWIAHLLGDRNVFNARLNPAPLAGKYTVLIPSNEAEGTPAGDGYGTVVVNPSGQASFRGSLADGTTVSLSAPVSKNGHWPFYLPLYRGAGSVLS
jgi:hypothetical protein